MQTFSSILSEETVSIGASVAEAVEAEVSVFSVRDVSGEASVTDVSEEVRADVSAEITVSAETEVSSGTGVSALLQEVRISIAAVKIKAVRFILCPFICN